MPPSPKLLAIGGALIDRRGRTDDVFVPGVSNPGSMREEIGGAAFNAARAAAQMGVELAMMSVRGGDTAGQSVAAAIEAAGMSDISAVHLDRATPSYTAILDHDGELRAALADMALFDTAFARLARRSSTRDAIARADAVLVDANPPTKAIAEILDHTGAKPFYANAISPAKVTRFLPVLDRLSCLFMNRNEAEALTGARVGGGSTLISALRALGLRSGVVTGGARQILFFDEADAWQLQPPRVKIADVTGAGDALAGATIAELLRHSPLEQALRRGAAAAALVAGSAQVSPKISHDSFAEMLERTPEPEPLAD